ncbi:pyrophosphatase PpaX [Isobaculum melis]|uniref:Pyrophosphatase PpaX n=1 Tax=Isobaculum melis TaxID=142588 RepID=A0A1H9QKH2_9LACT|nr:pyrophosphatase PpaX [Isobaculum melis]SER61016.1 pyrophosphatase PpaX [Isobaculum melis]
MKIDTILFDFDGTVANTNQLITQSHLAVLNQYYPGQYTEKDVIPFNGPSLEETYGTLNPAQKEEMIATFREYNLENHDQLIDHFPGVLEGLEQLKLAGFKLVIVSMKLSQIVKKGMEQLNMTHLFDGVVGKEMTTKHKPHPEPLRLAAELVGSQLENCIMVGDSPQDIMAGKNAEIPAVLVGWCEKDVSVMKQYQPDLVIDSMNDLIDFVAKK